MTTMKNLDRKVDFAITIGIVAVILILLHLYYSYYGHCSLFATNCHDSNSTINLTAALEAEGWEMECVEWERFLCVFGYDEMTNELKEVCVPCGYDICGKRCIAYTWRKEVGE